MIKERWTLTGVALAITGQLLAQAQLLPDQLEARGGGTYAGCNPTLTVTFTENILGNLDYKFSPVVDPGNNDVTSMVWSYLTDDFAQDFNDTLFLTYPAMGEYPVCLTVNAFDLVEEQPCSTTTCRLIDIVPDSVCLELVVDFTIGAVNGQTVTFEDLTESVDLPLQYFWDLGDMAASLQPSPTHTFDGNGPHKVCLSVVGPPPLLCARTICKWVYFGPGNVDCDVLLDPGFLFVQQGVLVGVLDTSITSGMESSVTWDFGDGTQAEGRVAVHAYSDGGLFDLCSTIRVWGPLLNDTCQRTHCIVVESFPAVGIDDDDGRGQLHAWPIPFRDQVNIDGFEVGPLTLRITDLLGRDVHRSEQVVLGPVQLELAHLPKGQYFLHGFQHGVPRILRLLKH